jgi:hypothetical protein
MLSASHAADRRQGEGMARHLFVVSRDHPRLYEYLIERFQDDRDVEVILDRRVRERRQNSTAADADRRRGDRRTRQNLDQELTTHSHVVITLA